jgi:hypothetical protein
MEKEKETYYGHMGLVERKNKYKVGMKGSMYLQHMMTTMMRA